MKRLLPLLPLLLVLGCVGGEEGERPVGSTAPDVKVETLQSPSTSVSLAKRRGKVVLLDFWATWCGPCKALSPKLERIYAAHKDGGLDAMAITTEAREIVALNEKRRPHAIPVYLDTSEEASRAFGVGSLPTVAVIDREGHIVYRTAGDSDNAEAEVGAAVEAALGKP